jgi:hypothetical protein
MRVKVPLIEDRSHDLAAADSHAGLQEVPRLDRRMAVTAWRRMAGTRLSRLIAAIDRQGFLALPVKVLLG